MFNTIIFFKKKLLFIIGNTSICKIYVIKFIVASLNSLDHIKSGEKKKGQLTYLNKKKKKKSHKTPHLVMNVENVVMLCKAWNLTNAYHLIAFYYYINQLELQSYSQKTKFIY